MFKGQGSGDVPPLGFSATPTGRGGTPGRSMGGRKSVTWSPAIASVRYRSPGRAMDVDEPMETQQRSQNLWNVVPQQPAPHPMAGHGPPLRALGEEYRNEEVIDENDLSAYEDARSEQEDTPEREFWVVVFGYRPDQVEQVLKSLGKHGTLVSYRIPEEGNFMLLRYSTTIHATQAISRSGMFLDHRTLIGICECEQHHLDDTEGRELSCPSRMESTVNESVFSSRQDTPQPEETLSHTEPENSQGRPGIRSLIVANADRNVFANQPNENGFLNKLWNFIV
ncbi:hypothetical protein L596_026692 [Steinernema carpocapsae]|uniref:Nucleoporin NUP35 n=1 Tax=Steinernema carpocapsae TaxID=34508 RepID=A0A4V5ZY97_STECR|nr:hypothetical protein L596_026692 [Steinernema carpocapsae]